MTGPKTAADPRRAAPLDHEQHDQDDERRSGRPHGVQLRRRDLEALDRGQHRDRRRDHAVAVEQRGAEDAEHHRASAATHAAAAAARRTAP